MSTCEIARRLSRISDRAIRFRLERLRMGSIINVTAILNTSRIGLPVMGDVLLEIMPWKYDETVARLERDPRVCYIAASADRTQISMQVNGHDSADVLRVVGQVLEPLDGVTPYAWRRSQRSSAT